MWCPCMVNGFRELDSQSGKVYFCYQCFCDERDVFITFSGMISDEQRPNTNSVYFSKVIAKLPARQVHHRQ